MSKENKIFNHSNRFGAFKPQSNIELDFNPKVSLSAIVVLSQKN
ncbi:hypothetical protein [Sodalis endosymbiont of Henestaris halophilus]